VIVFNNTAVAFNPAAGPGVMRRETGIRFDRLTLVFSSAANGAALGGLVGIPVFIAWHWLLQDRELFVVATLDGGRCHARSYRQHLVAIVRDDIDRSAARRRCRPGLYDRRGPLLGRCRYIGDLGRAGVPHLASGHPLGRIQIAGHARSLCCGCLSPVGSRSRPDSKCAKPAAPGDSKPTRRRSSGATDAAHRRKRGEDRRAVRPPHPGGRRLVSIRNIGKIDGVVPGAGRRRTFVAGSSGSSAARR
jgi:hypothetical protein